MWSWMFDHVLSSSKCDCVYQHIHHWMKKKKNSQMQLGYVLIQMCFWTDIKKMLPIWDFVLCFAEWVTDVLESSAQWTEYSAERAPSSFLYRQWNLEAHSVESWRRCRKSCHKTKHYFCCLFTSKYLITLWIMITFAACCGGINSVLQCIHNALWIR